MNNNGDWKLIFTDYKSAVKRFDEILKQPKSDIIRDASIKRFEFTVELFWKALKGFLKDQGISCYSPKSCLQEAFRLGLMKEDNSLWLQMIDDKNSAVHIYKEEFADALYKKLSDYYNLLQGLSGALEEYT